MTSNPTEYASQEYEEHPLTPRNDGKVQFLGPDTVKYISPPRMEVGRQRIRPVAPQPPQSNGYSTTSPPPPYQPQAYPTVAPLAPPLPPPAPYIQQQVAPVSMPMHMPMVTPQYIVPQMAPMITHQPQMMCMPTMQQPIMTAPVMTQMAQMMSPVQLSPPQVVQAQPQQSSPAITLSINQSPQMNTGPGGNGNALICPKCRKGIITRQQDKFRKKILMCLAFCCCPLTCGLPLICICCNYVDTCGACGKSYGHRGKKNYKVKVNAVKV